MIWTVFVYYYYPPQRCEKRCPHLFYFIDLFCSALSVCFIFWDCVFGDQRQERKDGRQYTKKDRLKNFRQLTKVPTKQNTLLRAPALHPLASTSPARCSFNVQSMHSINVFNQYVVSPCLLTCWIVWVTSCLQGLGKKTDEHLKQAAPYSTNTKFFTCVSVTAADGSTILRFLGFVHAAPRYLWSFREPFYCVAPLIQPVSLFHLLSRGPHHEEGDTER